jgi:hypothetical protein
MMVGQDFGVSREDAALLRRVQVRLDPRRAVLLERGEQREKQREQLTVRVTLPVGTLEGADQALARQLHRWHRIADDEGSKRRAANRGQLMRQGVQDHVELAAGHDEAAEHASQYDQETNAIEHGVVRSKSPRLRL